MKNRLCSVDGCSEIHRSKGFCSLHYQRSLKGTYLDSPRKLPAKGQTCSVEDCFESVRCKTLCDKHYDRAMKVDDCPICNKKKQKKATLCSDCWLTESQKHIPTHKTCTRCKVEQPVEKFGLRKANKGSTKWRSRCRTCEAEEQRERSLLKKLSGQKISKSFEDPEQLSIKGLKKYTESLRLPWDLVINEYPEDGNCKICDSGPVGNANRLSLDHDHETGNFRGFLCGNCNTALGLLKDNIEILNKCIEYLSKNQNIKPI